MTNSVRNSGRDCKRPPEPATVQVRLRRFGDVADLDLAVVERANFDRAHGSPFAFRISYSVTVTPTSQRSHCDNRRGASSSSSAPPSMRRRSTIRRASRLNDTGLPLPPSKTTTPTGHVSTSASRSAPARRSSRACGVGDGRRRLRRERDQNLLVGARELRSALLLSEKEVANMDVAVPHRRALHRRRHNQLRREAELLDIYAGESATRKGACRSRKCVNSRGPSSHAAIARVHAGCQAGGDAVARAGRIPDFPVTRSHPPASWPSAANSSICRIYRKTAGEESRRRSPVANRWMRP